MSDYLQNLKTLRDYALRIRDSSAERAIASMASNPNDAVKFTDGTIAAQRRLDQLDEIIAKLEGKAVP